MKIVEGAIEPTKPVVENIHINDYSTMSAEEILRAMNMRQRYDAMQRTPDHRYDQVLSHIEANLDLYRKKMQDYENREDRFQNIDDGGIHRLV